VILLQLSDLHVRPHGQPLSRLVEASHLAERALRAVAAFRPRPDAVLISGDLADCGLPGEYQELRWMLRRHLGGMRVLLIPGNHDRRENFRAAFGDFEGVTADPEFVQYVVEDLPVRLVLLDSVVPGAGHGELCARRLAWLDARLAEAPERPTLVALHHPPMHCGLPIFDALSLRDPAALEAVLRRHHQVERILCGHHHRSMVGRLAQAVVVVAPAVAHSGAFELEEDRGRFTLEPPRYLVHLGLPDGAIASHDVFVESYPGPFPYIADPDYPGGPDITPDSITPT
jgi:3',5'-cyclic AMP phosphodiesterase CpdA